MISEQFAVAMGLDLSNLQGGMEYITASGAVEIPIRVTKTKLNSHWQGELRGSVEQIFQLLLLTL